MIQWESDEPEDQTAQAIRIISEAVNLIGEHYEDATAWPGGDYDACNAVLLASRLLKMAAATTVLKATELRS